MGEDDTRARQLDYLKRIAQNCKIEYSYHVNCEPTKEDFVTINIQAESVHYHLCFGQTNIVRLPQWLADRLPERFVSRTYINCKVTGE